MPRRTQGWLMVVVTAGIAACGLRPVLAQEVAEISAERSDWPLRSIKADPRAAAAAGVVELCGSRALDWGAPAPAPQDRVAANRDGPAGGPLCLS